jgi:hypothetical protein
MIQRLQDTSAAGYRCLKIQALKNTCFCEIKGLHDSGAKSYSSEGYSHSKIQALKDTGTARYKHWRMLALRNTVARGYNRIQKHYRKPQD